MEAEYKTKQLEVDCLQTLDRHQYWGLIRKFDWGVSILGKYCWTDATKQELRTKLFRTRQEARDAQKTCCYKKTKVVRVILTITMPKL